MPGSLVVLLSVLPALLAGVVAGRLVEDALIGLLLGCTVALLLVALLQPLAATRRG